MPRRKMRKPRPAADRDSAYAEAVEQLRDAVGRLIARRLLREWTPRPEQPDAPTTPLTGPKRPC